MSVVETETRFQETRFRFHNVIYGAATYFLRVFRHQHNHKLLCRLPKSAPPRHLNIHVPLPRIVLLFYAPSFFLLYYAPILAVNLT